MKPIDSKGVRRDGDGWTSVAGGNDTDGFGGAEENPRGVAAKHAIECELALTSPAKLEEKLAAVVGFGVDGIDEAHARRQVQARGVGNVLEQDRDASIEIGLRNQGDKFLVGAGSVGVRGKYQGSPGIVGQLEDAELLDEQRSRRKAE